VGAVHEGEADHGVLGAEDVGVDLTQGLPAQVVIAIAGGALKMGLGDLVLLKGRQDLLGVLLRNGVDALKLLGERSLGLVPKGTDTVAYLKRPITLHPL
jgi:hypothetical protein